jgi:Ca2+-transporting ATPase
MKTSGLSSEQAAQKLKEYGFNEIKDTSKSSWVKILLRQVKSNFIIYLLFFSFLISIYIGKDTTAYTILGVIFMVTIVGFIQEYKAEEAINNLKKMIMPYSIVIRNSKKMEIPSKEIVPGDILVLGNGEKIPADCLILESVDLRVNESSITGESLDIDKIPHLNKKNNPEDHNKIFMGTFIVNGRCVAQVQHTGMNTAFGKIANLISTAEKKLPLQDKVNQIAKYMVFIAITMSIVTGALMLYRAETLNTDTYFDILILVVALAVSAFPEGFPVVLITTLAVGAKRMSEKNALVNRMSIIETLGEVTLICTDKTGTLTRGEMSVKYIVNAKELLEIEGSGFIAHGRILSSGKVINPEKDFGIIKIIEAGIVCNDSEIERTGIDNEYKIIGNPTEGSLLVLGAKVNMFKDSYPYERISEIPFNSSRKMLSVKVDDAEKTVYSKGAPEILLPLCSHFQKGDKVLKLTESQRKKLYAIQNKLANKSYRTLALTYKPTNDSSSKIDEKDLIFLGIMALEDSPREEVPEAIKIAQKSGIRVAMITGDNKETAISIARQVGILGNSITGAEMDRLSDEELVIATKETNIFARVNPEHKLRLIKIFKLQKEIVAMTGDGVNDAPALKEAHVGIAMGKNGTDVSRSASDLILKDDNFATIVDAIGEGRTIFNNIRKFVTLQLSLNFAELSIIFIGVLLAPIFGWYIPILVSIQILFLNLVTDNMSSITLGINPSSKDILNQKPKHNKQILNKTLLGLILQTAGVMTFLTLVSYHVSLYTFKNTESESRTIALITLIFLELVAAFYYRSFRKFTLNRSIFVNKYLVYASFFSIISTILIIYTPLNQILETAPISLISWTIPLFAAIIILITLDIFKYFNLKNPKYLNSIR